MENYKYLSFEIINRVAYITINRPDKRNALNFVVIKELKLALDLCESSKDVKIVVLRGSGNTFCAGADLEYLARLQDYGFNENLIDSNHLMELYIQIYKLKKPVIAQVNGHALAGGCGLVTVCDFAFSVPEAKFGYTEVKIGFIPAIVMVFLVKKIGEGKAREVLLSGDTFTAEKALQLGIIGGIFPADQLQKAVDDFAQRLCIQNSGGSMELVKRMLIDIENLPIGEAVMFAAKMNAHARATHEFRKGLVGFINKEKIEW